MDVAEPEKMAGGLAPYGFTITCREGGLVLAPSLDLKDDVLMEGLEVLDRVL